MNWDIKQELEFNPLVLRIINILALVSIISFSSCSFCENQNSREKDIAQIKRFLEAAGHAVNMGDVEAEVNRFTEDGIYM